MNRTFDFDGGRVATVYVPPNPPQSVVYAVDGGWHIERLVRSLEGSASGSSSTMVVGVHGLQDDDGRLQEYVEAFGGERFEAFEEFLVKDVRAWVHSDLGGGQPAERSAMWGASLGGEFALAMALRHSEIYGVALCASPGGGFTPASGPLPTALPRSYLVAGRQEPWFLDNARRWADAFAAAGAEVVMESRDGEHGGTFWYDELPRMVCWAFGR